MCRTAARDRIAARTGLPVEGAMRRAQMGRPLARQVAAGIAARYAPTAAIASRRAAPYSRLGSPLANFVSRPPRRHELAARCTAALSETGLRRSEAAATIRSRPRRDSTDSRLSRIPRPACPPCAFALPPLSRLVNGRALLLSNAISRRLGARECGTRDGRIVAGPPTRQWSRGRRGQREAGRQPRASRRITSQIDPRRVRVLAPQRALYATYRPRLSRTAPPAYLVSLRKADA